MGASTSKPVEVESKWFGEFEKELPELDDKVVAITGCTTGTGFVAARTCVRKHAGTVLMLNRKSERAEKAEAEVRDEAEKCAKSSATVVETVECDLQSFDSVRAAAKSIGSKYEAVDVLINNAGVMALDDYATGDGYDVQIQTNHLSHFLLTKELMPQLEKAAELRGEARVVNHSSMARLGGALDEKYFGKNSGNLGGNGTFGFGRWERYHQTKLANVVFTLGLRDLLSDMRSKVIATVAAPGLAATNLQTNTAGNGGMGWFGIQIMNFAQSAEDGTMPLLAAAFSPSKSGDFWEPCEFFHMAGPPKTFDLEAVCVDENARKMLWEKSEEACGCTLRK